MQSDNAPNLTAEVSNEFLKASHVTKVTSTAGHSRRSGGSPESHTFNLVTCVLLTSHARLGPVSRRGYGCLQFHKARYHWLFAVYAHTLYGKSHSPHLSVSRVRNAFFRITLSIRESCVGSPTRNP